MVTGSTCGCMRKTLICQLDVESRIFVADLIPVSTRATSLISGMVRVHRPRSAERTMVKKIYIDRGERRCGVPPLGAHRVVMHACTRCCDIYKTISNYTLCSGTT